MDTSEKGLGGVLYKVQDDGTSRVIAYTSRTLPKSDKNYDAHKWEFFGPQVDNYRQISWSTSVEETSKLFTDNNPLTYILTTVKLDATGQRWVVSLVSNNFKLHYRSGKVNVKAEVHSLEFLGNGKKHCTSCMLLKLTVIMNRGCNRDSSIPEILPLAISAVTKNLVVEWHHRAV